MISWLCFVIAYCNSMKNLNILNSLKKTAIILAAGTGMRMVPINTHIPKGLLKVNGEPLVERLIKQLHEADITSIYLVVGYMADKFAYLSEKYNVTLVNNTEFSNKNNLHSLSLVVDKISNTYIVPCDVWCKFNPFKREYESSWYMVSDLVDNNSSVRINKNHELKRVPCAIGGNSMVGIAYLCGEPSVRVSNRIKQFCSDPNHDDDFWEETLYENGKMIVSANVVSVSDVVEINTYEQLRELDETSEQLRSNTLEIVSKVLSVPQNNIKDIKVLKKGMTNRSFQFSVNSEKYIFRRPGEGTDQLINRKEEAEVYNTIKGKSLCDDLVYINPDNGFKITKYIDDSRNCNPFNVQDLKLCMSKLREFHKLGLQVNHEFKLFKQIAFYESLWQGVPSVYRDYEKVKEKVFSLKKFINSHITEKVLTHIDAVPDNFLIVGDDVRLIDWEYAGMQDPHVDLAMFSIYSFYNKRQVDRLINIYFDGHCTLENRIKIYCYISLCGLLWSNWCEYKRTLGVEFGEYAIKQYWYAKHYYSIAMKEIKKIGHSSV